MFRWSEASFTLKIYSETPRGLMLAPEIDWDLCQVCDPCLARQACKTRAIVKIDPDEPPYIELSRCTSCSQCVLACGFAAITMKNGMVSNANTSGRL